MKWTKRGLIYQLPQQQDWRCSHTQLPIVDASDDNRWRIYYSSRNSEGYSLPVYIDVAAGKPEELLREQTEPLLTTGERGHFDEHGVMPTAVTRQGNDVQLYYIGWSQKQSVPYQNAVGMATSKDGGETFERHAPGPLIAQNHIDPIFTGTLNILQTDKLMHAYYMSCTEWRDCDGKLEPCYHLRYACSVDGVHWQRQGHVCIDYKDEQEGGLVAASALEYKGRYHMWYCHRNDRDYRDNNRGNSYRIGYAVSTDAINWQRRDDDVGINISDKGWDSEMVCYPCVIRHADTLYMFYNGNGFGQSGIGYATCPVDSLA